MNFNKYYNRKKIVFSILMMLCHHSASASHTIPIKRKKKHVKSVQIINNFKDFETRVYVMTSFILGKPTQMIHLEMEKHAEEEVYYLPIKLATLKVFIKKIEENNEWKKLHFWNNKNYNSIEEEIRLKTWEVKQEQNINTRVVTLTPRTKSLSSEQKVFLDEEIKKIEEKITLVLDKSEQQQEQNRPYDIDTEDLLTTFFAHRAYDLLDRLLQEKWVTLSPSHQYLFDIINKVPHGIHRGLPYAAFANYSDHENIMHMMEVLWNHNLSSPNLPIIRRDDSKNINISLPPLSFLARICDQCTLGKPFEKCPNHHKISFTEKTRVKLIKEWVQYPHQVKHIRCREKIFQATQDYNIPEHLADEITSYVGIDIDIRDDTNRTAIDYIITPHHEKENLLTNLRATRTPSTEIARCQCKTTDSWNKNPKNLWTNISSIKSDPFVLTIASIIFFSTLPNLFSKKKIKNR